MNFFYVKAEENVLVLEVIDRHFKGINFHESNKQDLPGYICFRTAGSKTRNFHVFFFFLNFDANW